MTEQSTLVRPERPTKTLKKYGERKSPLTHRELAIMGKGITQASKPVECQAYLGPTGTGAPFDEEQSKLNKALGLW